VIKKMKHVAFVTGGTGLLGSWLIRSLVIRDYKKVYVLARGDSKFSGETRVYRTFRYHTNGEVIRQAQKKVEVINGDICKPRLGLPARTINTLLHQTTDIFHTAALADFRIPLALIRVPNVRGTKHVFELARLAQRNGGPPLRVHHISTVAVAGTLQGWFREGQFDCGQRFYNSYEQSKFEAEQIAHEYRRKGLNITIYRPAIITGDSKRGVTTNFKMIYQPLHFLAHGLFQELPANRRSLHSFVPVDMVAEAICLLSQTNPLNGVWHLINPQETDVGKFIDTATHVFRCNKPALIPVERFPRKRLSHLQWDLIEPFVPYFNYRLRFNGEYSNSVLRSFGFQWPKMDDRLLAVLFQYCIDCGYIRLRS